MAIIKGIAKNSESIEFLNTNSNEIKTNLHVTGNVTVNGKVITDPTIVTFADGTDEEIAAMLDAHYKGDINIEEYWHVGDTRKIHLNGIASPNTNGYTAAWTEQDITIVITTLNHHDLAEPIGTRDKAAVTLQTRECLNGLSLGSNENGCIFVNLNDSQDSTFSPWSKLPMRTWMNDQFYNTCFSDEWKALIKDTKHRRLITYNQTTTEEVVDKIFLPSYPEIFGNTAYQYYIANVKPNSEEGTQWDWYKTSGNRIKKGNSNGSANAHNCFWWIGSASSDYALSSGYHWCGVSSGGSAYNTHGSGARGLAPAFCL